MVCRLLICGMRDLLIVPPSVIKPGPLALGARSLSHWTTREVLWATTFFGDENLGGHELLQGNKQKTWGLKARGTGQVSPAHPSSPALLPFSTRGCSLPFRGKAGSCSQVYAWSSPL